MSTFTDNSKRPPMPPKLLAPPTRTGARTTTFSLRRRIQRRSRFIRRTRSSTDASKEPLNPKAGALTIGEQALIKAEYQAVNEVLFTARSRDVYATAASSSAARPKSTAISTATVSPWTTRYIRRPFQFPGPERTSTPRLLKMSPVSAPLPRRTPRRRLPWQIPGEISPHEILIEISAYCTLRESKC